MIDLVIVPDTWTGLPPYDPAPRRENSDAYGNLYAARVLSLDEMREQAWRRRLMADVMLSAVVARPMALCLVTGA